MLSGLFSLPWWGYVLVYFGLTHITAISISIFLHRHQAHRALDLHPIPSHFFRFWLWFTTGAITKQWVAVHRKHHAHCETKEDPHSPQVEGLAKVFFGGYYPLYYRAANNPETVARYGHKTPDDWLERNLYARHTTSGMLILLALNLFLFGLPGLAIWVGEVIWMPLFAAGIINGIAHYWGYRNFECKDASTNISPIGLWIAGEELHNNHHTYPTSAKLSVKRWEFDVSWGYISLLSKLGLATVKRLPPELHVAPEKHAIDIDTVKALLTNRFQVLAQYSREVIAPVFKELRANNPEKAQHLTRDIQELLGREDLFVSVDQRQHLDTVLAKEDRLKVVYQLRMQLQAIWEKSSASPKELLEALQTWARQAEQSGICALQEFCATLRSYTMSSPKAA